MFGVIVYAHEFRLCSNWFGHVKYNHQLPTMQLDLFA